MPRSSSLAKADLDRAVRDLEDSILKQLAARRLSTSELEASYGAGSYEVGWQFERPINGSVILLNLLLPHDFPFAAPRLAFATPPEPLTFPHVELDGKLCLLTESDSVDSSRPVDIVSELLDEAETLLGRSIAGLNRDDFKAEFLSYWSKSGTDSAKFVSLLRPEGPSRVVRVWNSTMATYFGEDEEELVSWVRNRNANLKKVDTFPAVVIWLSDAMLPEQYPRSTIALLGLLRDLGDARSLSVLRAFAKEAPTRIQILLATRSDTGVFYAGVTLYKPDGSQKIHSKDRSTLTKGFRPGHVPQSILADRYLTSTGPVKRHEAERADHSWIHGRDVDSGQYALVNKHVIILGCGSVGSPVAGLLAGAGVGKITLVDSDLLSWANTGRHHLGAKYVGQFKADALCEELRANYPHLSFDSKSVSWETFAEGSPEVLLSADLIVSTMGVWSSEGLLNQWIREVGGPPIVFGWTEAFAIAGHAVAIFADSGCLRCQFDEHGEPKLTVARFERSTLKQEAACGASFQPYGPIEVSYTCNIVAEQSIDVLLGKLSKASEKIWAGREDMVTANGGVWTKEWLELAGDKPGGIFFERTWESNTACPVCKKTGVAC